MGNGFIQICPSGSDVGCYVDSLASSFSAVADTFHSSVVPLLLGALVLVLALTLGKWLAKNSRP